jgi:hypothetical protein
MSTCTPQVRRELQEVGWTKGLELSKVRTDGKHFDCATWLHKAHEMPEEKVKQEVEKELTGRETEPWEIVLSQLVQKPDTNHRPGDRDCGFDAGNRQISGLLHGDDLRRLLGRSERRK